MVSCLMGKFEGILRKDLTVCIILPETIICNKKANSV